MSQNIETVNAYLDGFRKNDHEQILSCLTDDIEWTVFGAFHLTGKEAYDKAIDGAPEFKRSRNEVCNEPMVSPRVDSASRFIPASPSDVYAAFADPRALASWIPPKNMAATMLRFDFREGGSYRMRLSYDDPESGRGKSSDGADEVEARFLRLIDPERIEQAVRFESADPAFAGVMRMTWTFDRVEDGTLVTVRAEDVPPGIRPEDHEAGMNSSLENLASFLGGGTG